MTTSVSDDTPSEWVTPSHGDYVLATKYHDGDPGDPWAVGFYDKQEGERHFVVRLDGSPIGRYRCVRRISPDVGRWLIEVAAKVLEASPPGSVNLWTMLTWRSYDADCCSVGEGGVHLKAERDRLRTALEALVPLQAHYAGLLNQYDGGARTAFASVDAWLARLDELHQSEKPR